MSEDPSPEVHRGSGLGETDEWDDSRWLAAAQEVIMTPPLPPDGVSVVVVTTRVGENGRNVHERVTTWRAPAPSSASARWVETWRPSRSEKLSSAHPAGDWDYDVRQG